MTPDELQAIRERDAGDVRPYEYAIDGQRGCDDRRALLAHVDALQAQLGGFRRAYAFLHGAVSEGIRQVATARHLLAWQAARARQRQAFAVDAMKGAWRLKAEERDRLRAECSRYSTALETISAMGCDGDGDTCSCAPCRADEALTGSEELSEIAARDNEITRLTSERDAARAEVERLRQQISDEQDLGARCQAMCGECKGLCGPDEDALSEREVAS